MSLQVDELDLSVHAFNCLKRANINYAEHIIVECETPDDICKTLRCSGKTRDEIISKLEQNNMFYYGRIRPESVDFRTILPVSHLFNDEIIASKLQSAGISTIADLMYELLTERDVLRIGLTEKEFNLISSKMNDYGLHLGTDKEYFSDLYFSHRLINEMEKNGYYKISDVLERGFNDLIDCLGPFDAVQVAIRLKSYGYLLIGYPGLDDPETCEMLKDYFLEQPLDYLGLDDSIIKPLQDAGKKYLTIESLITNDINSLYSIIPNRKTWEDISEKLQDLQLPPLKLNQISVKKPMTANEKRISQVDKLNITISGPNFSTFGSSLKGFSLFANFKNITDDLMTVEIIDFYVVDHDQQISSTYFLTGYSFSKSVILPQTVRSCAKIWDAEDLVNPTFLPDGTYVILTVQINSEECNRMYKFLYTNNQWKLDDYFKV